MAVVRKQDRDRDRGSAARRMTLAQRRVLLERIRAEVAGVVEDIAATAETLGVMSAAERAGSPAERATIRLLEREQRRQQLELMRLFDEYELLTLRTARATRGGASAA